MRRIALALMFTTVGCKKSGSDTGTAAGTADPAGTGTGTGTAPAPPPASVDAAGSAAAPPDPTAKIQTVLPAARAVAADPVVVKAVKDQNGKKLRLDAIKQLDEKWAAATGTTDDMKPYLEGKCADALRKHATAMPAMVEAFAMDDQGALVCSINRTTDYWQGDEDKWVKSFAGGQGADFVDKPKFDESSQTYSVQLSIPVKDGDKTIGAITVGLSLDKL